MCIYLIDKHSLSDSLGLITRFALREFAQKECKICYLVLTAASISPCLQLLLGIFCCRMNNPLLIAFLAKATLRLGAITGDPANDTAVGDSSSLQRQAG